MFYTITMFTVSPIYLEIRLPLENTLLALSFTLSYCHTRRETHPYAMSKSKYGRHSMNKYLLKVTHISHRNMITISQYKRKSIIVLINDAFNAMRI